MNLISPVELAEKLAQIQTTAEHVFLNEPDEYIYKKSDVVCLLVECGLPYPDFAAMAKKIHDQEYCNIDRKIALSKKIENALKESKIEKQEFAKMMNTVPSQITRWLRGDANITINKLLEMEQILKIKLLNVTEDSEAEPPSHL